MYKGIRINNTTLTNKMAEMLLKDGLERWFEKIKTVEESNENNEADKVD